MKHIALLLGMAMASQGRAVVIESFEVPYQRSIQTGSWVDYQTDSSLFSGERDVQVSAYRYFDPIHAGILSIGNGQLEMVNQETGQLHVQLEYDGVGDEVGNTGEGRLFNHSRSAVNNFPSGTDRIRFNISFSDNTATLGAILFRDGEPVFFRGGNVPRGSNIVADFTLGTDAFRNSDALVLYMITRPLSRLRISSVETVPEPTSGVAFGAMIFSLALARCGKHNATRDDRPKP